MSLDYTLELRKLMQQIGITSFSSLAKTTGVSQQKLQQLRRGNLQKFRLEELQQLSQVLHISLIELLTTFQDSDLGIKESPQITSLRQEYQRLQAQMQEQRSQLLQEFHQTSLQTLETWLLQWERVANHARNHPEFSAAKLLPLMRPVEQLLESWGVEAIAPLGAEIPYNPQWHRLQAGTASAETLVKVHSPGYKYQGKLLHRAEVVIISARS